MQQYQGLQKSSSKSCIFIYFLGAFMQFIEIINNAKIDILAIYEYNIIKKTRKDTDMIKGYNIQEASEILKSSKEAIRKKLIRGTLQGKKENGRWIIYIEDTPQEQDTNQGKQQDKKQNGRDAGGTDLLIETLQKQVLEKDNQINYLMKLLDDHINQTKQLQAPKKRWWKRTNITDRGE